MNKEYFNITFNQLIFKLEDLKTENVSEISDEIDILRIKMDVFKEECLRKIKFSENKKRVKT